VEEPASEVAVHDIPTARMLGDAPAPRRVNHGFTGFIIGAVDGEFLARAEKRLGDFIRAEV
jgi:hypothetical protein